MEKELIIIIDFGGKYVQLIARQIRQFNVYCEILPYSTDFERIKAMAPKGFIFTGNVVDMNNPDVIEWTNRIHDLGLPIMSIDNLKASDNLKDFLYNTCHCSGSWRMSSYVELSIRRLKEKIGDQKVLCALSGGVDSSVAAVMISKAVGKQLTCIFVDHGLLRKNEADEVEEIFSNQFDLNLIRVNAQDRFYNKLAGVTDPESKRKIIGEEFIRVFEDEAKKIGRVDYLVQGTIYPDIIESGVGSGLVKSHHNVGGLPDYVDFKEIIEPLRDLFKDEVRQAGLVLGIPEKLVYRQPFPGPGLGVRIIGDITPDKVKILQEADYIYREEIAKAGLDKQISQYFAVLTNLKSVGVKNNERTYDYTVALRAVKTSDFMTAEYVEIPWEVLGKISTRIVNEVDHVNRICYDITGKPPATIEWE
ncbi:MAG: glutamine-hydrolyzing GMP synthase [Clostridiales bacterium]|jgi:GMP synthase (glutamine-hydrolysing)|nr:glutamine-hydrolyzing GMP synthase [Clostridiales bacterium]